MSFAKNYNTGGTFNHSPLETAPYVKPLELLKANGTERTYPIRALYISDKGRFGLSAVIACDGFLVNAPSHLTDTIQKMINDESAVNAINAGIAGFKVYPYSNNYGEQAGINWVDIEPTPEPDVIEDGAPF